MAGFARRRWAAGMNQQYRAAASALPVLTSSYQPQCVRQLVLSPRVAYCRRSLHEQYGLSSNWNRRPADQSRMRLIGRLDRILGSPDAQSALSPEQLVHIQYLRDFWAQRGQNRSSSPHELQQTEVMTHETKEVLGRYSAQVNLGSVTASPDERIPMPHDSAHRQLLKRVERVFGEQGRLIAKQAIPFRKQIGVWVFAALLAAPMLFLLESGLMHFFPERAKALEETEKQRYQEAHDLFYGAVASEQGRPKT